MCFYFLLSFTKGLLIEPELFVILRLFVLLRLLYVALEFYVGFGLLHKVLRVSCCIVASWWIMCRTSMWAVYFTVYLCPMVDLCEEIIALFQVFYQFMDGFLSSGYCSMPDRGKCVIV